MTRAIQVSEVLPQTQAESIRLRFGDVIWTYGSWRSYENGRSTRVADATTELIGPIKEPGMEQRNLTLLREGIPITISVRPGQLCVALQTWFVALEWLQRNIPKPSSP